MGNEIVRGKSLIERAPSDIHINWTGKVGEQWDIGVRCTITSAEEAEAVCEIIRLLSANSQPDAPLPSAPNLSEEK